MMECIFFVQSIVVCGAKDTETSKQSTVMTPAQGGGHHSKECMVYIASNRRHTMSEGGARKGSVPDERVSIFPWLSCFVRSPPHYPMAYVHAIAPCKFSFVYATRSIQGLASFVGPPFLRYHFLHASNAWNACFVDTRSIASCSSRSSISLQCYIRLLLTWYL